MKIYNISQNQLNTVKLQNTQQTQNFACSPIKRSQPQEQASKILANYNKANISFGSKQEFITYGVGELILKISDSGKKAASIAVELVNKTQKSNTIQEFAPKLSKREKDGNFYLPLIAVNAINNEYLDNIQVKKVISYDINGEEIATEEPKGTEESLLEISPKKEFSKTTPRKFTINENEGFADIDVISTANTEAKLKIVDTYDEIKNYKGEEPICAILNSSQACNSFILDSIEEDFILPVNVKGIFMQKPEKTGTFFLNCLSHAKARLEGKQAFVMLEKDVIEAIKSAYEEDTSMKLIASIDGLTLQKIDKINKQNNKVELAPIKMTSGVLGPKDKGYTANAVGVKAYNLGKLQTIAREGGFKVPKHIALPAGWFEDIKKANTNIYNDEGLFQIFSAVVDKAYYDNAPIDAPLEGMRALIEKDMIIPDKQVKQLLKKIKKVFNKELTKVETIEDLNKKTNKNDLILSVRSSFPNFEDLDIVSTQGMFDSVGGVKTTDELLKAVKKVWASKWGRVAAQKRFEHGIAHNSVQPAVLIQEFIKNIDYVFTAYTQKVDNPDSILIDLSQGLTNGMQGDPYLFEVNRKTGEIRRTLMATKGRKKIAEHIDINDKANLKYTQTDYSTDPFNKPHDEYAPIIKKISDILLFVEKHFGGKAQDIEGGIKFIRNEKGEVVDVETTLWQTRDVQMQKD